MNLSIIFAKNFAHNEGYNVENILLRFGAYLGAYLVFEAYIKLMHNLPELYRHQCLFSRP